MAPSLRDLIDFLLAEIALCGSQGASPANVLSFIDIFYSRSARDESSRSHVVDRRFQEKVWQWLMGHPEVSVGKDREGNHLTLEETENLYLNTTAAANTAMESQTLETGGGSPVRVFVSEERTWLAITGHGRDDTKVLPMEFALLSIIASRGSSGITQPELIKLSGQDKRSVPKRTDVLHQKGYIAKRAIQIKAARTSLCTLRRFLDPEYLAVGKPANEAGADAVKMIDFGAFTDKLFGILREHKIISRTDLKESLGFADHWRWKVLSRALRKFERIGVVKRVRALSQYANTMRKYHPCVMLVRDPTEKDIAMFHDFSIHMYSDIEQSGDVEFDDDAEADDSTREPSSSRNFGEVKAEQDVEMSGRIIPSWTPDRCIHNQLFDAIDRTGTAGCTNSDVIRACLGVFYRRPLENTMARLVECWQVSQPPHLRHLAIVRDTTINRTITHYIHYSSRNFSKLVDAGESSWEAVEFVARNAKTSTIAVPPIDEQPKLDAYGLPLDLPKSDLLNSGDCSLMDCVLVARPQNYLMSSSDPRAVELEDGTYSIHYGVRSSHNQAAQLRTPTGRRATPDTPAWVKAEGAKLGVTDAPTHRPIKRSKRDTLDLTGLSEIEKLKAMGFDETWTEYSVHLIDRNGPGVYVTAKGRRRAAGRRQGRPRISRVAVFKSSKLRAIPWFTEEGGHSEGNSLDTQSPQAREVSEGPSAIDPHLTTEHDGAQSNGVTKRKNPESESLYTPMRASKLRRIDSVQENSQQGPSHEDDVLDDGTQATHAKESEIPFRGKAKRKRVPSPEAGQKRISHSRKRGAKASELVNKGVNQDIKPRDDEGSIPFAKSIDQVGNEDSEMSMDGIEGAEISGPPAPVNIPPHSALDEPRATSLSTPAPTGSDVSHKVGLSAGAGNTPVSGIRTMEPSTPAASRNASMVSNMSPTTEDSSARGNRLKLLERGGSVSFLRRKIVLDIVEKAGGAFPMGSEIWYPFMTAWLKTKYKERPDMRTLRSAVKQLVDAGKLRQQTFCGRDSKGVMVTKNIICKPELPPDDPIIKDLQANILASDARYYFPPGVEIDPSLTRQTMTPKGFKQPTNVPVEPTITVQLHQKPASVAALEKRRGQNLQRRLLRKLEMEGARENMQETRPSGVIRLLSIQRPEPTLPPMHNLISSFGDAEAWAREEEFTGRKYRSTNASARHLKRFLSMMASHTMLMNPRQSFNPNNGTFSTDAGIAVIAAAKAQPRIVQRREPHLPESLDDLFTQTRKRDMPLTDDVDPRSRNFFRDTNRILRWELQNEELLQRRSGTLHYINQGIQDSFESAPIEGGIRFDDGDTEIVPQSSVQTREQAHSSLFIHHEHPPFKAQPTYEPAIDFGNSTVYSRAHLPSSSNVTPSSFRHSLPQHRRIEKLNEVPSVATDPIMSSQNRQHGRRNRLNAQLPRSAHQRITMTIVVVRALAGGADGRMVDWPLVSHCFPDQDPKTVQDKGKGILSRNRLQIAKMQSDFQERYIEAYANDEVPPIDYDDLYAYDWNAVIDWASTQLDIPKSERVPDLPATRQQFDEIFELREEPLGSLDEYYQHSGVTALRKKALISSVAFATPLSSQHSRRPNTQLSRFDTVKTWIRANTITPAEVYRPSDAKKALSFIDGGTLNAALQSLVVDRVIYQNAKGRSVPGRNYDMTDHFLQTLSKRRPIELAELRRAVKFKTETLDPTLTSQGVCSVAYGAEDGDILALINLLFQGRITLRPRDPPRDKFGLTEGGYLTRMMNKDKLRFPVDVYPVKDRYIRGNPISEKTSTLPPPCPPLVAISETLSIPETIPLWFDIHGGFIRVLWDQAVSAVLGCVAARPGITASNVASMVKPTLGAWEIELLLEWLVELGVMWKTGDDGTDAHESCWAVKEWWWMVMC
ncbi:hypothetical protein ASPCAL12003 [Aspergillus calidoustus]|uniref:Uncharacterized protein n=1 Tax=Aspergillus calidoustus TaxID=454130 RepID=A0A0U5CF68_ASPCI|nr:hypothetical protein ASPCAL12003 [Aspergillus calidoustus]